MKTDAGLKAGIVSRELGEVTPARVPLFDYPKIDLNQKGFPFWGERTTPGFKLGD